MYFLGRQDACLFHSSSTASSLLTFASSESISLAVCFLTTLAHPLSITSPIVRKKHIIISLASLDSISGLANKKTVTIQPVGKEQSVLLATSKTKKQANPASLLHKSIMKKEFNRMAKAVVNQVAANYYRPDLKKAALARLSSVNRSLKVSKSGVKKRNRQASRIYVDAVVNSTNENLHEAQCNPGLHAAAGPGLAEECATLGGCRTGMTKVTNTYDLPARRVIHTVGPNIAMGCVYYPREPAAHVAIRTVRRLLEKQKDKITAVVFCLTIRIDTEIYKRIPPLYFPRDIKEEEIAISKLPADVGDGNGETIIDERKIRIKPLPNVKKTNPKPPRSSLDVPVSDLGMARRLVTS
ncbi:hypothetical protein L2E82_40198 [Cichorium intybus]|uniref:Uncharacterized protein n=1 Tax=Cichorium intybus TaxID=13427 RepID=A0ACB9AM22_CICIN|nr:hypothetical protein L2E82_40198 [Cichorium intybus]